MAKLSFNDISELEEYLKNTSVETFFGRKGLTNTEINLFDTMELLFKENQISKQFLAKLRDILIDNRDSNGDCLLIIDSNTVDNLVQTLKDLS